MKIEHWPLERLTPYARNPRKNDQAVDQVAGAIREYGFRVPIIAKSDGTVIDGHLRLKAAHKLAMETVPVVLADDLTETQIKAFRISVNRMADLADWDTELLALELEDLRLDGFDIDLTGFDADALDALMDEAAGGDSDDTDAGADTEPEVDRAEELRAKWGVEPGQLWQLGEHRLLCGDSTNADDVAWVMGGAKADAVLTDPPYGQNQAGVPGDEPERHAQLMEDIVRHLPITDGVVVAFQSPRTFHAWTDATRKAGLTFERMLWLYKAAQCTFPWRGWILTSESIPVCSIGKANWQEVHPFSHDCYYLPEVSGELSKESGWHGSVKPISVVSDLLSRISAPRQIIYEPFSGSGTTLIAGENLGRKVRAIEISPAYVAVTLERWHQHTGQMPERVGQ